LIENYQRGNSRLSPAVVITAVFLVGMVLLMFLQTTLGPGVKQQIEVIQVTQQVSQSYDQPWMVSTDDVTVYVPANSLASDGTLSIARVEQNQFPVSADVWTRPRTVVIQFLDPAGSPVDDFIFLNNVEVCFRLTPEQWQDFMDRPGAYQVQHYRADGTSPGWEVLPMSTYDENFELCGQTARLSAFALGVLPESEIPVTGPTIVSVSIPTSSVPRQIFQPYPTRDRERPSATPRQPTSTPVAPTVIVVQPTRTSVPPTQPPPTQPPPTQPPPPTHTPLPTNTPLPPPTQPPTNTPLPPLPTEEPTATEVPVEPSPLPTSETPSSVIEDVLDLILP
jgi:hypothetical protein